MNKRTVYVSNGIVIKNKNIISNYFHLIVKDGLIAKNIKPGQFVMLRPADRYEHFLNIPFSIYKTNCDIFEIIYKVVGIGTKLLAKKQINDDIFIIGPLGNGFNVNTNKKAILIGGGYGIAPLVFLSQYIIKHFNIKIYAFIGGKTKNDIIFFKTDFKKLKIETFVSTENGSYGKRGKITTIFKEFLRKNNDFSSKFTVYSCGPLPMMYNIARISKRFDIECQLSMEEKMCCGVGVCLSCICNTRKGKNTVQKLVCYDGPVFSAESILI